MRNVEYPELEGAHKHQWVQRDHPKIKPYVFPTLSNSPFVQKRLE